MIGRRLLVVGLLFAGAVHAGVDWRPLAPGLELTVITAQTPSAVGDSRITVVRADPARWQLTLVGCDAAGDERPKTAKRWARGHDLAVAINAGMFATDHRTHLGYLETRGEVRSRTVNAYQSVAAFDPHEPGRLPPFRIFDLDVPGATIAAIRRDYSSLVQNLRLIKKPGANRWSPQEKKWSEAALGEDGEGRVLLLHCRSPFSMHDLNRELLQAGIDLVAAQHLEGGPEAQLYLRVGETELELVGSFETDFRGDSSNTVAWPVPHVLGLRPRVAPAP